MNAEPSTAPAAAAKSVEIAAPATAVMAAAEFNREAALKALNAAANAAKGCKTPGGPTGTCKVSVTFAPSGAVTDASIISGAQFGGTDVGKCIIRLFRAIKVPPFAGSPMTVAKSVAID